MLKNFACTVQQAFNRPAQAGVEIEVSRVDQGPAIGTPALGHQHRGARPGPLQDEHVGSGGPKGLAAAIRPVAVVTATASFLNSKGLTVVGRLGKGREGGVAIESLLGKTDLCGGTTDGQQDR
jgi:hypothetical protein